MPREVFASEDIELVPAPAPAARIAPPPPAAPAARPPGADPTDELVRRLQQELEASPEPDRAGRLYLELGRLHEERLANPTRAGELFQHARRLLPDSLSALLGVRRALAARHDNAGVLASFDDEAGMTASAGDRARVLVEKARFLEERMGQRKQALEALRAAVELVPDHAAALAARRRLEAQGEAWRELDEALERSAAAAQAPGATAAHLAARARVAETRRNDPAAAIEFYRQALALDSRTPGAAPALRRLLDGGKRWRDRAEALALEADRAAEATQRARVRQQAARLLLDQGGDPSPAIELLEAACRDTPDDDFLLAELVQALERTDRPRDLGRALERQATRCRPGPELVAVLLRLGALYAGPLEAPDQALLAHARALHVDPAFPPLVEAQARLLALRQDWRQLVALHVAAGEAAIDGPRRAASLFRAAQVAETSVADAELARGLLARAVAADPAHTPAFRALCRLHEQAARWAELATLLEARVDVEADVAVQVGLCLEAGRLHENALRAPEHALALYRRAIELAPGHREALHAAVRAAERSRRWADLVRALDEGGPHEPNPGARQAAAVRAAEVTAEQLADLAGALVRLRAAERVGPNPALPLEVAARLLEGAGRDAELLAVHQRQLATLPRGAASATLLHQMATLAERALGDRDQAARLYREALAHDRTHRGSLRALIRLLEQRGEWEEVARLLEGELPAIADEPARVARTALRLHQVHTQLGHHDKALAAAEKALAAAPGNRAATEARLEALERLGERKRLAEALLELARQGSAAPEGQAGEAERGADQAFRAALVYRDELADPARALEALALAAERAPQALAVQAALAALAEARGDHALAMAALTRLAEAAPDPATALGALHELLRLQEARAVDAAQARETAEAILAIAADDRLALGALGRVAERAEDPALRSTVEARLGTAEPDAVEAAQHLARLGTALMKGGQRGAVEVFRAALQRDPANVSAARGLSTFSETLDEPALLAEAAEHEARAVHDLERAERLLVHAAAQHRAGGDAAAAAGALTRALELNADATRAATELDQVLRAAGELERLERALGAAAAAARRRESRSHLDLLRARLMADRDDLPGALTLLAGALGRDPNSAALLAAQGDLYAQDRQWSEAVDRYGRALAASPDAAQARHARLAVASILDERLGDPSRALSHVEAVLREDPDDREALAVEVRLLGRAGKAAGAAAAADRLLGLARTPAEESFALTQRAHLHRASQEHAQALDVLVRAIARGGMGEASTALHEWLADGTTPPPPGAAARYAGALEEYLTTPGLDAGAVVTHALELSRVRGDDLGRSDQALTALLAVRARAPHDPRLKLEIALRQRQSGDHARAVGELLGLIEVEPTRAATWRDLSDSYEHLARQDEARWALAAVVALGVATDGEQMQHQTRALPPLRARGLDAAWLRGMEGAAAPDPLGDVLAALSECQAKVVLPTLERFGVSARDRITSRSGHPVRALADRVAACFGVTDFDLYLHALGGTRVEVEPGDAPALMFPSQFSQLAESQQAFLLARALAAVARRLEVTERLGPHALQQFALAGIRVIDPTRAVPPEDEPAVAGLARAAQKALSRRSRRALEEAVSALGPAPLPDTTAWLARTRRTSTRAALLLADDLPACITLLRRLEGDLSGQAGPSVAQGMANVQDLLRFWISEPAAAARRRVGLVTAAPGR